MKYILSILLFCSQIVNATTYYVATTGNDGNPGTIGSPFLTWEHLASVLVAGDIAYIRGGTYTSGSAAGDDICVDWSGLNGTITDTIKIYNYPGEVPVMDLSDVLHTPGGVFGLLIQTCDYVHIKGLRITGLAQNPSGNAVEGMALWSCDNFLIENVTVDNIGGSAYTFLNCDNNLILNCDAHHCGDEFSGSPWDGANGFAITSSGNTSTGNTFRSCRAWWISDDGWDFFNTGGTATIDSCWSFWNGYEPGTFTTAGNGVGFKLGPGNGNTTTVIRFLNNNLAFHNRVFGFDENYNSTNKYPARLYNNTSYDNGAGTGGNGYNFISSDRVHIFINNVDYDNDNPPQINAESTETTNSWQGGITVTDADFNSVSSTGMNGARGSDGSLPVLNFMKLASTSDLRGAGTQVGYGLDLGCFQYPSEGLPNFIQRGRRVIN